MLLYAIVIFVIFILIGIAYLIKTSGFMLNQPCKNNNKKEEFKRARQIEYDRIKNLAKERFEKLTYYEKEDMYDTYLASLKMGMVFSMILLLIFIMGLICMIHFSPYNIIMLITVICIMVIIVYIFSFCMIAYIKSSTEFQDNVVLLLLEKKIKKEEFEKDVQSTQNWDKKEKSTPGIVKDIQEYNKIKEKNKRNGLSLFTILFLPFFILGETDRFLKQNYYPSGMAKKKRKRRK